MKVITFVKLRDSAQLPERAYSSQGYDLCACLPEPMVIAPGETKRVSTGLAGAFEENHVALVMDRGGLGASAIHRLAGVIDADYRGEWKVVLCNLRQRAWWPRRLWAWLTGRPAPNALVVRNGDKIAQVLFVPVALPVPYVDSQLPDTLRGARGFGSSDRPALGKPIPPGTMQIVNGQPVPRQQE
jgi:dUTP pyrophosphatase